MEVSAIIPQWNRSDLLGAALQDLRTQSKPPEEFVVVDNGSTDDSVQVAEKFGAKVIRMDRNVGFACAVNRGIDAAAGEWLLILNNDVRLTPRWLETMISAARRDRVLFACGKLMRRGRVEGTFDALARSGCAWRCGADREDGPLWNTRRRIRFAPLTATLVHRQLFANVGMLDETFGSYLEDVEFGLRCALAGQEGVYVPEAVAEHLGSATLGEWNKDTVRRISRNQVLLSYKHLGGQARWPILAGQLLWGLTTIRHGRGVAWALGKWEGLRERGRQDHQKPCPQAVRAILEASEREIFELQQSSGWDAYWRAYFWVTRR